MWSRSGKLGYQVWLLTSGTCCVFRDWNQEYSCFEGSGSRTRTGFVHTVQLGSELAHPELSVRRDERQTRAITAGMTTGEPKGRNRRAHEGAVPVGKRPGIFIVLSAPHHWFELSDCDKRSGGGVEEMAPMLFFSLHHGPPSSLSHTHASALRRSRTAGACVTDEAIAARMILHWALTLWGPLWRNNRKQRWYRWLKFIQNQSLAPAGEVTWSIAWANFSSLLRTPLDGKWALSPYTVLDWSNYRCNHAFFR